LRVRDLLPGFKRVRVEVALTPVPFEDYTAKLVKSFLSCVDDDFAKIFSVEGGYKEFHITPLLDEEGRAIYPKRTVKCSFCTAGRPSGKGVVPLPPNASFELSGPEELVNKLFSFDYCKLEFGRKVIEIETVAVEEVDLDLGEGSGLWVKFRGPAVLRDPWRGPGEELRTRFLPSPSHLFSVNAYSLFKDKYLEVLWKLERSLVEDHSALHSAGKVWYYYDRKWLPALSGSALFWVREADEDVKKVIAHAALFGVGSGRAAGFGDVVMNFVRGPHVRS